MSADADVDPDTVAVTLRFDAPVSREDLRERFAALADRLADADENTEADR